MAVGKNALKAGLKTMMPENIQDSPLAEMLGVTTKNKEVVQLPIPLLDSHPEQHHYSMDESELEWLAENVREVGVLQPIHVRPKQDGRYTILAGHRRTEASRRAGMQTVPAFIENVDDAKAAIIFNATNLGGRQKLLPSEKAYGYSEIEKNIARKEGATLCRTTAAIAEATGDNIRTIQRYKRLNQLQPDLLLLVDKEQLSFNAGVELSYLSEDTQANLLLAMEQLKMEFVTAEEAKQLRALHEQLGSVEQIMAVLRPEKNTPVKVKKPAPYKVSFEKVEAVLPEKINPKEFEEIVIKALQAFFAGEKKDGV